MTNDDDLFDALAGTGDESSPAEREPLGARLRHGTGALFGRRRNRVIVGVTVTAVVLASGTTAVYAATQGGDGNYRTAVAEKADVTEALDLSGQLASANSADVAFQVDGTVSSVSVALGDEVKAGQNLATLDTGDLQDAVTKAEDAVAAAAQTLEDDLEAQANGTDSSESGAASRSVTPPSDSAEQDAPDGSRSGGSTPGGSTPGGSTTGGGSDGGDGSGSGDGDGGENDAETEASIQAVTEAQQNLLTVYEQSVTAGEASTAALASAREVCAPFLDATLELPADDGYDATEDPEAPAVDDATIAALQNALKDAQGRLTDCQDAVATTQTAQESTEEANGAVTDAAEALNDAVAALEEQLSSADQPTDGSGDDSSPTAGSDGTTASTDGTTASTSAFSSALVIRTAAVTSTAAPGEMAGDSAGSGTITAERILADQAAIDSAEAQLAIAKQDLGFATLTSPIEGTIVAVSLATGDDVTAGSDSAVITVQSAGGYIVDASVGLSMISKIEVGQTGTVALPAFGASYDATVASIGVLNTSSSSTPSYTVTLAVDAGDDEPRIGATATATVQLASATGVLTVPTSAVTRSGSTATVQVLTDGAPKQTVITLGAIGAERAEITDGLAVGDVVVLADLDQKITSDDTSGSGGRTAGRFSSGDFPSPGSGFSDGGDFPAPPGS
ncbi:HlyD family efflux transporter periplasmic adaptor subunit [Microbacterium sp. KUDC0406]|uniref:HlyD family efflux transporter periplasmic adaptor subunit n=1 Tax=Microbacterium sp. KUDC0406 TaxID=2909588 RepID=UPI001F1B2CD9|nr:HlyD family efflux transporter periplasmic adaptor subunit [Microbacterium sp. KUDC0406]UJP11291.1 HlyD family efflux transporter periplasmic adaptor subunit [Microbacterium sp. KUDC0406]